MGDAIYFSKIEFREHIAFRLNSILLINLVEGTLAYQVYKANRKAPTITGIMTKEVMGHTVEYEIRKPAVRMKNSKTGFQSVIIEDDIEEYYVVFSYTYKFTNDEKNELLSYCNVLDYEPYRHRKMSMKDEGYLGYRDEISVYFTGVTDSYIPMMRLPMDYYYDEKHIWPSEKLYRYIMKKYMTGKKLSKWVVPYGGLSLMF